MKNIIQNHNKDQNEIVMSLDNKVVIIKLRRQWEHVLSKIVTQKTVDKHKEQISFRIILFFFCNYNEENITILLYLCFFLVLLTK